MKQTQLQNLKKRKQGKKIEARDVENPVLCVCGVWFLL